MELEDAVKILNTFLLADIPEIITQEEFDLVKKSIQTLLNALEQKDKIIDTLSKEQTHKQDEYCENYCNLYIENKCK